MWRFVLVGLACVPLLLWGVDGVGGTTSFLEPKKPAVAPEPSEASAVLGSHDAVAVAFALPAPNAPAPEPPRNGSASPHQTAKNLHDAAVDHRSALAEAIRFVEKACVPVNDDGKVIAAMADVNNVVLKEALQKIARGAEKAYQVLTDLQKTLDRDAFLREVRAWLEELPRESEKWKPFPATTLQKATKARGSLEEFENDHRDQTYLVSKANQSRNEWAKTHAAMKGINEAAEQLDAADSQKEAIQLKQLLCLADLVDLVKPIGTPMDRARAAAHRLCDHLLPSPRALDATVLVVTRSGTTISVPRTTLKVRWADKAKGDSQPLGGDGKGNGPTEFTLDLSQVDEFCWNKASNFSGAGARLEPTPKSKMIHEYNKAVEEAKKSGRWTKAALQRVYEILAKDAAVRPLAAEHLGQAWEALERLNRREGRAGLSLFE